jgi:uncharacterized protein (UPF0333 family)
MNRGQAALEFLITYGWALAALIAAIMAITYFTGGYKAVLPNMCDLETPFSCVEYKVGTDGVVILGISNNAHEDLIATNVTIYCNQDALEQQEFITGLVREGERLNNSYVRFQCPLATGNRFRASFFVTYTPAGTGVAHTSNGELRVKVE